ncbi:MULTISPECIES: diaminobutyrate acetyltransferase [Mycobacteriaceae]|uniref:diaminobutyrate acetyltransferase n=1 Tax=Mycobacteriaceae TaxID=1762 RepID=UPI00036BC85C|nr:MULTISPECIES: diaminobutyrate acetyltransferase [Mycobacteriaceae]AMO06114.1 L-2,4-diaminobutyric acid acetyltransferase [Mycolicibacterium neoaurum]AXK75543.1 diaminobutyrate acetyltransferase [Mycolicibacterium neoaurum]KUM09547.1 L-2,4-diaminobutyric acid acetyltransferase [Mycolicibacterium neoaurum]
MNGTTKTPVPQDGNGEIPAPVLRRPRGSDAIAIRRLVAETDVLDLNSTYAYLLFATDFADTSVVAEVDGRVTGVITGYSPPNRRAVLFVWQVAVATAMQGRGIAAAMLDNLVHRVARDGGGRPLMVEATVAPDNAPSRAFFAAFARRHGVPMAEQPHFTAAQLDPDLTHADEPLLRIGPVVAPATT